MVNSRYLHKLSKVDDIPHIMYNKLEPAVTKLISSTAIFILFSQLRSLLFYHPLRTEQYYQSHLVFNENEVFNGLYSLDITKAMGMDGLGPSLLKSCALCPLVQFFNPLMTIDTYLCHKNVILFLRHF